MFEESRSFCRSSEPCGPLGFNALTQSGVRGMLKVWSEVEKLAGSSPEDGTERKGRDNHYIFFGVVPRMPSRGTPDRATADRVCKAFRSI